jgi:hypothetical protein
MRRWLQLIRGIIGTGVAFAIGGGAILGLIGTTLSLLGGPPMRAVLATTARGSVLGFLLGVAFSLLLALVARGRAFASLGLSRFAALGGAIGMLAWLLMGVTGAFHAWSLATGLMNLGLLTAMGGGSASAILLLARRAQRMPEPSEKPRIES